MKQKKEQYFSLYFQIGILVVCVFTGILLLMTLRDAYSRIINRERESLLSLSSLFNDITIETEACHNMIAALIQNTLGGEKSSFQDNDYQNVQQKLLDATNLLAAKMNEDSYNRSSIDLKYMAESYLKYTALVIHAEKIKDYSELNQNYQKSEQTYGFIQAQMSVVYREIQRNNVLSGEQLDKYNRHVGYLKYLTISVIFGFGVLLIYLLDRVIIRPINKLAASAGQFSLQSDNLQPTVREVKPESEIDALRNTLFHMQKRICSQYHLAVEKAELGQQLEAQKLKAMESEKHMKEAELKNLQARINPHFLFNSINLISKMAYIEQAEQTSAMMESLGELLRYNLDNFSKIVTLGKEIENIRDYTIIQKMRFGDRIEFTIHADERIEKGRIPCLILQPLVENAIIHGVGMYTKGAVVRVDTRLLENDRAEILIYDNGMGMEADELDRVRGIIKEHYSDAENGSIGLSNVFKRLQLFFNNNVIITVDSRRGQYTKVKINIPFKKESKE